MGCSRCGRKDITCPHCNGQFKTSIKKGDIFCPHCNQIFVNTPDGVKTKPDYEKWMQDLRSLAK